MINRNFDQIGFSRHCKKMSPWIFLKMHILQKKEKHAHFAQQIIDIAAKGGSIGEESTSHACKCWVYWGVKKNTT